MSRKNGQKVIGLLSAEVLELANGKYVLSTILDITSQRKAEQTLRESEQKFSKLFHHSPVAMSVTFLKTNQIVDVNEAFLKLSGFSRKEIVGKTSLELNSLGNPKDREDFFRIFMQEGCVKEFEAVFFDNNNDTITGLLSAEVY